MSTEPAPVADAAARATGRYRVLTVRGRDAGSFLQGQLTRDVAALGEAAPGLAALLTPQGRVIATPWLARAADGFDLALPAALAPRVRERLQRFVLRAKVTLGDAPADAALELSLAARVGAPPAASGGAADAYALALVRAGLPEVGIDTSEEWIPQMLNLDLLEAISFQKGCYTGQEIVARTQHLGRIKRRMLRYAVARALPPAAKAGLSGGGRKCGEVVLAAPTAAGVELLAVVNLDARDAPLTLDDGSACTPLPLPYAVP